VPSIDEVLLAGPNANTVAGSGIVIGDLQTAITNANSAVQPGDLEDIATSGSIYDVVEAETVTGKNIKYLVFNGGSATSEW
jgi:hypothetical protein